MEPYIWPMILVLIGVLLIFMEIFVPSGGMIAIFAAVAVIASIVVGFTKGLQVGTVVLLIDTLLVPVAAGLAFKTWRHTPFGRRIVIQRPGSEEEVLPDTEEYRLKQEMVGKRGTAKSRLLPSGDVVIQGRTFDAVSKGMPIDPGQPVMVVGVDTLRLVVRPLTPEETMEMAAEADDDLLSTPIDRLGIDPLDDPLA